MMMSSDTSAPESMTFFAASPRGVPALTAALSMSPVEICGIPNLFLMTVACVPLPAPGGPKRINRMSFPACAVLHLIRPVCRMAHHLEDRSTRRARQWDVEPESPECGRISIEGQRE